MIQGPVCSAHRIVAEDHLPLVAAMVRRFPGGQHEPEELYQQGCIGLMKAIARYDPDRGTAFSTFAVPLILGEMRMLSRRDCLVHIPRPDREQRQRIARAQAALTAALNREPTVQELSAHLHLEATELMLLMEEVTVSSADAADEDGSPLSGILADPDDWLTRVELRDLIGHLPAQDQQLMQLRYGEGFSQAETAAQLGMTQVQVSRRERVLRRQLRDAWYAT